MKKIIISIIAVTMLSASLISCQNKEKDHTEQSNTSKDVYTCPMHPEVISDKPGACPKCGMELVKKESEKMDMKGDTTMKM